MTLLEHCTAVLLETPSHLKKNSKVYKKFKRKIPQEYWYLYYKIVYALLGAECKPPIPKILHVHGVLFLWNVTIKINLIAPFFIYSKL